MIVKVDRSYNLNRKLLHSHTYLYTISMKTHTHTSALPSPILYHANYHHTTLKSKNHVHLNV